MYFYIYLCTCGMIDLICFYFYINIFVCNNACVRVSRQACIAMWCIVIYFDMMRYHVLYARCVYWIFADICIGIYVYVYGYVYGYAQLTFSDLDRWKIGRSIPIGGLARTDCEKTSKLCNLLWYPWDIIETYLLLCKSSWCTRVTMMSSMRLSGSITCYVQTFAHYADSTDLGVYTIRPVVQSESHRESLRGDRRDA